MTEAKISLTGGYKVFYRKENEEYAELFLPREKHCSRGCFKIDAMIGSYYVTIPDVGGVINIYSDNTQELSIEYAVFETEELLSAVPQELVNKFNFDCRALYFSIFSIINNKTFIE